MVDTRPILGGPAMINQAYAEKHGYQFHMVHAKGDFTTLPYASEWSKPLWVAEHLPKLKQGNQCTWLVLMDSDSFVREFDLPLPAFLGQLAQKYGIRKDIGAILAREESIPGVFTPSQHWLNTGVIFFQIGSRSQNLLKGWLEAGRRDQPHWKHWPYEQGTLTNMLQKNPNAGDVAVVRMREFNSPWGLFIEHVWGGAGRQKRHTDFADMLVRLGIDGTTAAGRLSKAVVPWAAPQAVKQLSGAVLEWKSPTGL